MAGSRALLRHRRKIDAEDSGRSCARTSGGEAPRRGRSVALDDDVGSILPADCELLSLDLPSTSSPCVTHGRARLSSSAISAVCPSRRWRPRCFSRARPSRESGSPPAHGSIDG